MKPKRKKVPKGTSEAVLKEFSHLCAICGAPDPQLHHIDEDPSNFDRRNLIPLCPNHHLTDQHNPTAKLGLRRLRLFRDFKDPIILTRQFHPLFYRMEFLLLDNPTQYELGVLKFHVNRLISFVSALEMGTYYGRALHEWLIIPSGIVAAGAGPGRTEQENQMYREAMQGEWDERYLQNIREKAFGAVHLCVELLRFQDWKLPDDFNAKVKSR